MVRRYKKRGKTPPRFPAPMEKTLSTLQFKGYRAVKLKVRLPHRNWYYHIGIVTKNPEVNLQSEQCYIHNLFRAGKRPPARDVIINRLKPSGWRKLQAGFYVGMYQKDFKRWKAGKLEKSEIRRVKNPMKQLKTILRSFNKKGYHSLAHEKEFRRELSPATKKIMRLEHLIKTVKSWRPKK